MTGGKTVMCKNPNEKFAYTNARTHAHTHCVAKWNKPNVIHNSRGLLQYWLAYTFYLVRSNTTKKVPNKFVKLAHVTTKSPINIHAFHRMVARVKSRSASNNDHMVVLLATTTCCIYTSTHLFVLHFISSPCENRSEHIGFYSRDAMPRCDVGGKYAMIQNDRLNFQSSLPWFIVITITITTTIISVAKNRKNLNNVLDNCSD